MIIGFTKAAGRDLISIGQYVAEHDPAAAERLIDELYDRCWSLTTMSRRFPIVRHRGRRTIRKITHGNYLIFYWHLPERVEVGRVLHAKRNWRRLV